MTLKIYTTIIIGIIVMCKYTQNLTQHQYISSIPIVFIMFKNQMENWPQISQYSSRNMLSTNQIIRVTFDPSNKKAHYSLRGDCFHICKGEKAYFSYGTCRNKILELCHLYNAYHNRWKCIFRFISLGRGQFKIFHVETELYLTICKEQFNYIIFTEKESEGSIFQIQLHQKKVNSLEQIPYNQEIYIRSVQLQKYLYSQKQDKSVSFSNTPSMPVVLHLHRRQLKGMKKNYLQQGETVLLKNIETNLHIGLEKKKQFFETNENCGVQFNPNSLKINNFKIIQKSYLDVEKNKLAFLWEVDETNNYSHLIMHRDQIIFKHFLTGVYLIKNMNQSKENHHFELSNQETFHYPTNMGLTIKNMSSYCLGDQFDNQQPKPIYLPKGVDLEGQRWVMARVEKPKHLRIFNNEIISLCERIAEFMEEKNSLSQNLDQFRDLIEGYKWILNIILMKEVNQNQCLTEIQCCYLLKVVRGILSTIQKGLDGFRFYQSVWKQKKTIVQPLIQILYSFLIKSTQGNQNVEMNEPILKKELVKSVGSFINVDCKKSIMILTYLSSKWQPSYIVRVFLKNFKEVQQEHHYWFYFCLEFVLSKNPTIEGRRISELLDSQHFKICQGEQSFSIYGNSNEVDLFSTDKQTHYYLYEMVKLSFHSNSTIRIDEPLEFIENMFNFFNEANCPYQINTILYILQKIYFQSITEEICALESRKYIFFPQQSLTLKTNVRPLLHYSKPVIEIGEEKVRLLMIKLLYWERQNIENSLLLLDYFSHLFSFLDDFISVCDMSIGFLNELERMAVELCSMLIGLKSSSYPNISRLFKKIGNGKSSDMKNILTRLKYEELVYQMNDLFNVIYWIKQRLFAYPFRDKRIQYFEIEQMQSIYNNLVPYTDFQIPVLRKIIDLYASYSVEESIVIIKISEKQTIFQQFVIVEQIIRHLDQINEFAKDIKSIRNHRGQGQGISSIIIAMKEELDGVNEKLHKLKSPIIFQAYQLSDKLFSIVFTNVHFEEQFIIEIVKFLCKNPPRLCVMKNFNKIISNQMFIRIFAYSAQKNCSSISQNEAKQILEVLLKKFDSFDVLNLLGIISEIIPNEEKLAKYIYNISLNLQFQSINSTVLSFLEVYRTAQFLKSYIAPIKDNQRLYLFTNIILSLSSLFRLSHIDKMIGRHLSKLLTFQNMLQIAIDENIPYKLKMPLPIYFALDRNIENKKVFVQYIVFIRQLLSEHEKYKDCLKEYTFDNGLQIQLNFQTKQYKYEGLSQQLSKLSNQNEEIKKNFYWQFLFWKPFYQKEQGVLVFLEYLITNVNHSVLSVAEEHLQKINETLKQILKLFPIQNFLTHQIRKILGLSKQKITKLRDFQIIDKSASSCLGYNIANFLFEKKILKKFVQIFYYTQNKNNNQSKNESSKTSTIKQSQNSQLKKKLLEIKMGDNWIKRKTKITSIQDFMGMSEDSNNHSHHAMILPKSTIHLNLNKIQFYEEKNYLFCEILDLIKKVCKQLNHQIQIQLEEKMLNFFNLGGTTKILRQQIIGVLELHRNRLIYENCETFMNPPLKLRNKQKPLLSDCECQISLDINFIPNLTKKRIEELVEENGKVLLCLVSLRAKNREEILNFILKKSYIPQQYPEYLKILKKLLKNVTPTPLLSQQIMDFLLKLILNLGQNKEKNIFNEIVDVYCLHEKKSHRFNKRFFIFISTKIFSQLSGLALSYSIKAVLNVLLHIPELQSQNLFNFKLVQNFIYKKIQEGCQIDLLCQNIDKQQKIVMLTIINDYIIKHMSKNWKLPSQLELLIHSFYVKLKKIRKKSVQNKNPELQKLYRQCMIIKRLKDFNEGNESQIYDSQFGQILLRLRDGPMFFVYQSNENRKIECFKHVIEKEIKGCNCLEERKKLIYVVADFIINESQQKINKTSLQTIILFISLLIISIIYGLKIQNIASSLLISLLLAFNMFLVLLFVYSKCLQFWNNSFLIFCIRQKQLIEVSDHPKDIFIVFIKEYSFVILLMILLLFLHSYSFVNQNSIPFLLIITFIYFHNKIQNQLRQMSLLAIKGLPIFLFLLGLIFVFTFFSILDGNLAQMPLLSIQALYSLSFFDIVFSEQKEQYRQSLEVVWFTISKFILELFILGFCISYSWPNESVKSCVLCEKKEEKQCKYHSFMNLINFIIEISQKEERELSEKERQVKKEVLEKNIQIFYGLN